MKSIVLSLLLAFSGAVAYDETRTDVSLTRDPTTIAFEAYSDLWERVHFVHHREGTVVMDYRIEFYGRMAAVDTPFIFSGNLSAAYAYEDSLLGFYITMRLYNDEHQMFMYVIAQDGEIIHVDADEYGAMMIYMAVGEAMYDMLWGSSYIPFVVLPKADIDSFSNVRIEQAGDYITIYFTLTNASAQSDFMVDADIMLVLRYGTIPISISIDMIEVNDDEHAWQERSILEYIFELFSDTATF